MNIIEKVLKEPNFEGCYYEQLTDDLFLVISHDDTLEDELIAKIAYNCDDLQCDYDFDWYMPTYKDGETAFVECSIRKDTNADELYNFFLKNAKSMQKEIDKGNLLLN